MLQTTTPDGNAPLSYSGSLAIIFISCGLGLLWAIWNWIQIKKINTNGQYQSINSSDQTQSLNILAQVSQKISDGAKQFLKQEYIICFIFVIIMFFVIYGAVQKFKTAYTAFAFLFGAITSIICGIIGMLIATQTNSKTAYLARISLDQAFKIAYKGASIIGFSLVAIQIIILVLLIIVFKSFKLKHNNPQQIQSLFQSIAGYAFGASTVALFARVGGGIFTKAADVGADLVGKIQQNLSEDNPRNPAVIADNVGDNVGDIVGMNADLFASLAEAICASLLISSVNLIGTDVHGQIKFNVQFHNMFLPFIVISFGIICSIITSIIGILLIQVDSQQKAQSNFLTQVIISTFLLSMFLALAAYINLPAQFQLKPIYKSRTPGFAYSCLLLGLLCGVFISLVTRYVTSSKYNPVQEVAQSSKISTATNIIYGLALGYHSTVIPVVLIAVVISLSNYWLGYYGVSIAAVGMLSNLPLNISMDGYGPICDNAKGIAQMSHLKDQTKLKLNQLNNVASGTEAAGKGYSMGSACLVGISLYGAYLQNAHLNQNPLSIYITSKAVFAGLMIGAMIPYIFSAFTMRSVGKSALTLLQQVKRQINENSGIIDGKAEPNYKQCIRIITKDSLLQMAIPALIVFIIPLLLGISFGPIIVAGYIIGVIISGIHLAISAANSGGAWDSAAKFIENGNMLDNQGRPIQKYSQQHKAAVLGDLVGDPLKDTTGPGLNILIKLSGIICIIFADIFYRIHY